MAPRRYLPPMPIAPLYDHPAALHMTAAAFGALVRLCVHFWATECRPLPTDDESLMQIARAHRPTWRHHKPAILEVFASVSIEMNAALLQRKARKHNLIAAQAASVASRKAARLAASQSLAAPSPFVPQRSPPKPQRPTSKATRRFTD